VRTRRHSPRDIVNHPGQQPTKYCEIIADNLKKRGWSLGWISALDSCGRTIWIADAHRDDGKRFVVRADEKLTAFLELESATHACGEQPRQGGEIFPKLARYEIKHSAGWGRRHDIKCVVGKYH
jgi:hypothetical protein